jgi:hypothetical protein
MKRTFVLLLLVAGTAVAQSPDLGVMLGNIAGSPQRRVEIAKELGASWYRPEAVLLGEAEPMCADCSPASAAGLKLVLVVRNSTAGDKASTPATEQAAFQQKIRDVLDRYKPEIVVVENEPEDKNSFAGTPEEYGAEVKAACDVAHSAKLKCTDGALGSANMAGVVIDELWKTDKLEASDFGIATEIVRAKSPGTTFSVLGRTMGGQQNMQETIEKSTASYLEKHRAEIDRSRAFLLAGASAGTDFANFHWYELKPEEVSTVLDILGRLNKRPQMTNEVGQTEERAFETGEKIRILLEAGVRPVIWAGMDGKDKVGLVDKKGNLRPTGKAFQMVAQKSTSH